MIPALAVIGARFCVIGFFAGVATVAGAVKLGLETYEKWEEIRERRQQENQDV